MSIITMLITLMIQIKFQRRYIKTNDIRDWKMGLFCMCSNILMLFL